MKKKYRWSMYTKLKAVLIVAVVAMATLIWLPTEQTNEPEEQAMEAFEAEPLVIENSNWEPQGAYYGTIVIEGPGIEGSGYEGSMFITMDGDYIRVTCTDAVRSRFGDVF